VLPVISRLDLIGDDLLNRCVLGLRKQTLLVQKLVERFAMID
jgi:hypothetical protein